MTEPGVKTKGHLTRRGYTTLEGFVLYLNFDLCRRMQNKQMNVGPCFVNVWSGVLTYFDRWQSDAECPSGVRRRNSREIFPKIEQAERPERRKAIGVIRMAQ
jgi:hypothetical protein